jgi:hypothetical protein
MHRLRQQLDQRDREPRVPDEPAQPQAGEDFWAGLTRHLEPAFAAVDEGQVEPGAGMRYMMQQMTEAMRVRDAQWAEYVQQQAQGALEPVQGRMRESHFQSRIEAAKEEFAEDFNELAPRASALIQQWSRTDPEFVRNEAAVDAAFNQAAREFYVRQRKAARAETVNGTGGGRGPARRQVDPAEAIIAAMDDAAPQMGGGGL